MTSESLEQDLQQSTGHLWWVAWYCDSRRGPHTRHKALPTWSVLKTKVLWVLLFLMHNVMYPQDNKGWKALFLIIRSSRYLSLIDPFINMFIMWLWSVQPITTAFDVKDLILSLKINWKQNLWLKIWCNYKLLNSDFFTTSSLFR